ncbi:tubulin polyglutamylase ttll6-like isoform X2 [Brachyhypopomus gauderio]|uniref:tubulin polyglutamylase ttll6-like isoform X2 n=1 Tax=Brachyhypopomus gauderio TaxID=698409 RepID=UPI0040429CFE
MCQADIFVHTFWGFLSGSVRRAARRYGLRETSDGEEWTLYWTDLSVTLDRVMDMKWYQINHFPGMSEICRKDMLARNLNRMLKCFPKDYNIFPKTWCLPADYSDLQAYGRRRKHKTYICKPEQGCQGRGIFLSKRSRDVTSGQRMVCQLYICRPFLIDGLKFDLRIYVLVTSCDPLRAFLYEEGLVRFCTTQYSYPTRTNLDDVCMHLTNYAINKHSENFVQDDITGSKRKLSTLRCLLEERNCDTAKLWADIEDVVIKALISVQSVLCHNYHTCFPRHAVNPAGACFELLGFDVMLDRHLKPWLLEVNHSPSFTTQSRLDQEVKDELLYDTLVLVNLAACDWRQVHVEEKQRLQNQPVSKEDRSREQQELQACKREQALRYEDEHLGGFRRILPCQNGPDYDKYLKHSRTLFKETAASRARVRCTRQLLQDLQEKHRQGEGCNLGLQGESAGEKEKAHQALQKHHCAKHHSHVSPGGPLQTIKRLATLREEKDLEDEEERQQGPQLGATLLHNMAVEEQVCQLLKGPQASRKAKDQVEEEEQLAKHMLGKLESLGGRCVNGGRIVTAVTAPPDTTVQLGPALRPATYREETWQNACALSQPGAQHVCVSLGQLGFRGKHVCRALADTRACGLLPSSQQPLLPDTCEERLTPSGLQVISAPVPLVRRRPAFPLGPLKSSGSRCITRKEFSSGTCRLSSHFYPDIAQQSEMTSASSHTNKLCRGLT